MRVQATDIFGILHLDHCSTERDSAMSNLRERLRTLRTGWCVRPSAVLHGYKFFLQSVLSSHRSRLFDISCSYKTSNRSFVGDVFLSRCHGPLHARGKC